MSCTAGPAAAPETDPPPGRVGYIVTHYPMIAQTFIAGEIDAVERAGLEVACFAMNAPAASELDGPGAAASMERTTYLKPALVRAAAILVGQTLRHPIGLGRAWVAALKSGGGNPRRILRRISHLTQAALVADIARRRGIARLHAHFGLAPATIAWLATAIAHAQGRRHATYSFTIHGFHDFADPKEARLDLKARDAAAVVCISDFTKSQLFLNTDSAQWPRFRVVRCGIDPEVFAYRDPPPLSGPPRLMALGRLSPEKGFAVLIEAVARLHVSGLPASLRIVGDGPARDDLEVAVRRWGISEFVTFTGQLSPREVGEELFAADIFCMSSLSEGLPVSLMEAMAIGVPVVTTWISGIPELAADGVTAATVPPANAEAMAEAVERLARDDRLRHDLARAARARVVTNHDVWQCGTLVAALLQESRP